MLPESSLVHDQSCSGTLLTPDRQIGIHEINFHKIMATAAESWVPRLGKRIPTEPANSREASPRRTPSRQLPPQSLSLPGCPTHRLSPGRMALPVKPCRPVCMIAIER